jgi:hypothetical protein
MPRRSKAGAPAASGETRKERRAHDELDALRDKAASERVKVRDAELALAAAKAEVEDTGRAVVDGYAAEDQHAVRAAREREHEAVEKFEDAQHRLDGAVLRLERVETELRTFESERAPEPLAEAEASARTTTLALQRAATETARAFHQYRADRERIQQLVNAIEPGAGQVNGPPSTCSWERELGELARALRLSEELEPPLPRWYGRAWRRQEDEVAKRLRSERTEPSEVI